MSKKSVQKKVSDAAKKVRRETKTLEKKTKAGALKVEEKVNVRVGKAKKRFNVDDSDKNASGKIDWKCFIADGLTFARFVIILILFVGVMNDWGAEVALVLFVLGELTDAFDGSASKKWPFPKGKEPKYRKFAEKYDMWSDTGLMAMMFLFVMFRVDFWFAFVVGWIVLTVATIVELVCYGKFFGHPDDCEEWGLYKKEPKKAEKILLARRLGVYIPAIGVLIIRTFVATGWPVAVKVIIVLFGVCAVILLWRFLKPRREKVARD